MVIETKMKRRSILGRMTLTAALLLAVTGFASVAGATYELPADRAVKWEGNVGVKGDIPTRTTIYKTLSPSGGDDATAIQTAINNCPAGQVVKLSAGTFSVSSPITLKSEVTLRGSGMGSTVIKGTSGMPGAYLVGIKSSSYSLGTPVAISSGLAKGSSTISTSTAHGLAAGDVILIDQLNNAQDTPPVTNVGKGACTWCGRSSGTRSLGQMVQVASVPSATTATLEMPLYWKYDSSLAPQVTKIKGITKNAGVEELTVNNLVSASSRQGGSGGTIAMTGSSNSWLYKVEAIGSYQTMVRIYGSYRNTIRGSKFHGVAPMDGSQYGSGRGYAVWLNPYASANLIENNQLYDLTAVFLINGSVSGNVISYNYVSDLNGAPANWNRGIIVFHGAHPMMNLIEGNISDGRHVADNVWGSSSHNTFFRNRHNLTSGLTGGTWNVDIQKNQQYYNIVGNVIGNAGYENFLEFQNQNITISSGQKSIYRFGYTSDGDSSASGNDPNAYYTALRHGNWDSFNRTVTWSGSDDRVLPPSLYLKSQPAWWGYPQWPAIGPDVSPMFPPVGVIGKGTPWDGKGILSAPLALQVK